MARQTRQPFHAEYAGRWGSAVYKEKPTYPELSSNAAGSRAISSVRGSNGARVDQLAARQSVVNKKVYGKKFGLFLGDDQESKLEAITSRGSHESCSDSFVSGSYGYHQRVLTDVDEIRTFFTGEQKGLVVLHVSQEHSFSRLKITQSCFDQLVTSAKIFDALKDNILHIGFREKDIEVAPPAPSLKFLYDVEASSHICGFEMAYGLRFIEANGKEVGNTWSLRQCVIYNKTHHTDELSQWMFFCLPEVLREQVDYNLKTFRRDLVLRPFDIHLMMFSTAIALWRPYFIHIFQEIESCRIKVNMSDPRSHESLKNVHENTYLVLKDYETDILDAILAIRATKRTLAYHQRLWQQWCMSQQTSKGQNHTSPVRFRFSELSQNLDGVQDQAQSLLEKVRSISETVASFLALASSYSSENIADQSKYLAKLSQEDSFRMKILAENAQKDTKAVKALSVITLIYLPITVVLNFFSTSFVSEDHGNVQVVGRWWLLVAASVPLTLVTLIAWGIWICRKNLRQSPPDPEAGPNPAVTPSPEAGVSPVVVQSSSSSPSSSLEKT